MEYEWEEKTLESQLRLTCRKYNFEVY